MQEIERLLENNKTWSESIRRDDPSFFRKGAEHQAPEFLWIGCSDSRVPGTDVVGLMPGQLFVHRNIANLVVHTDMSCLSVIHYAVHALRVKHIIICGHYRCGGVTAAMGNKQYGPLDGWLRNVKDIYHKYEHLLAAIADPVDRADKLCELNVIEQVHNVCHTPSVQEAWRNGQTLAVHGWIYQVQDGLIQSLDVSVTGPDDIPAIYRIPSSPLE